MAFISGLSLSIGIGLDAAISFFGGGAPAGGEFTSEFTSEFT